MVDRTRNRIGTLFVAGTLSALTICWIAALVLTGTMTGPSAPRGPLHAILVALTATVCAAVPASPVYALPFIIALRRRSLMIAVPIAVVFPTAWVAIVNLRSQELALGGLPTAAIIGLGTAWLLAPKLVGPRFACSRCARDLVRQLKVRAEHCPACGEPIGPMELEFRSGSTPGRSWVEELRPTETMDRLILLALLHQIAGSAISCVGLGLSNPFVFAGKFSLERAFEWINVVLIFATLASLLLTPVYVGALGRKSISRAAVLVVVPSLLLTLSSLLFLPAMAFAVFHGTTLALLMLTHFLLPNEPLPAMVCIECGYDVRTQMSAGIETCPECGAGILAMKSE